MVGWQRVQCGGPECGVRARARCGHTADEQRCRGQVAESARMAAQMLGSPRCQARAGYAGVMRGATDWLRAWDSHGRHRTGTEADEAGAVWLAGEAQALGARVCSEEFVLDRIDPVCVHLQLNGTFIEAVPVFDAPPTDRDGIIGSLGPAGGGAVIGVAELSPHAVYSGEYQALRRNTSHRALIIVCRGTNPGMG